MSTVGEDLPVIPLPVPPPPSAALEAELANLAPVAPRRPMRQLALLLGISLIYGGGVAALLPMRRDLDELPMGWLVGAALCWIVGFVAPVYFATVPRRGAVIPRWPLAALASVIGAVGFIALGLMIHPDGPHSVHLGSEHFASGYSCLEVGLATALMPVVVGAVFLRGALPVGSRWIAAALGTGGGSLGGLLLHFHCSVADGLHLGLVHGSVVLISAVLAALLVPRATTVR